ncbi:MAG: hypothetical protein GY804_11665 [Alphaproteobacteria bacterium]|nr:hypothetical protein [Alphaproteobacteria bacterium]
MFYVIYDDLSVYRRNYVDKYGYSTSRSYETARSKKSMLRWVRKIREQVGSDTVVIVERHSITVGGKRKCRTFEAW